MLALITWDIWVACALGVAALLAVVFEPPPIVLFTLCFMLGAYVVVDIIDDERNL
jgi:hypothetical protein